MRRSVGVLAALAVAIALPAGSANSETPSPTPRARIAKVVTNPRAHVKLVRRFTPTATPSALYMRTVIIPAEAAHWHVSVERLDGRVWCESKYAYGVSNPSGAKGAGQFMDGTWRRALEVWSRPVVMTSSHTRLVRRKVKLVYDDGSVRHVRGRFVRQRVSVVRRGLLPRWPSVYHGWANVRATARALAGRGHVGAGEWSCA